jgi:HAE1 family hydrophobic/amphiphilic exporter-1
MPSVNVQILRDKAATLGINAQDIEYGLSLAYGGGKITTYKTDVDQYDVILELDKKYQAGPSSLSHIYLHSSTQNDLVPLSSVVKWSETVGPQNVPHFNQLNSATVSFSVKDGVPLSKATKELDEIASQVVPPEVHGSMQGEAAQFEGAMISLGLLIIAAIFILYVILGILYESYIHPFTILTTLPVASFGGLATLLLFRSELSLYAFVGMFMLLGIVTKNGIMMVDFANQNMEEKGMSTFDAIYDACLVRFRPILMTGVAAIMGAMPIALGLGADGASRQPMGLIVAGGLIFSQIITLFVTPGIFIYMQTFQEKYLNKFEMTRAGSAKEVRV